jgi:hypothetical protein
MRDRSSIVNTCTLSLSLSLSGDTLLPAHPFKGSSSFSSYTHGYSERMSPSLSRCDHKVRPLTFTEKVTANVRVRVLMANRANRTVLGG